MHNKQTYKKILSINPEDHQPMDFGPTTDDRRLKTPETSLYTDLTNRMLQS